MRPISSWRQAVARTDQVPHGTHPPASATPGRGAGALACALAFLLLALFLPDLRLPRDIYEYVVVFDITQSMDVADAEIDGVPVSRLQLARESARLALRELPCGSRIGWGAFTEYRTLLLLTPVEVCANYHDLVASLEAIDGRMRWSNASEIGKGVYWAARAALDTQPTPDVIFISDGHEAPPLRPGAPPFIPEDLQRGQVRGWIVGTGSSVPQPIPKSDDQGRRVGYWRAGEVVQYATMDAEGRRIRSNEHLSALHENHLQAIANRVGFEYIRLDEPALLVNAMLDRRFARRRPAEVDLSWLPLTVAIALLVWVFRPSLRGDP